MVDVQSQVPRTSHWSKFKSFTLDVLGYGSKLPMHSMVALVAALQVTSLSLTFSHVD